MFPILHASFEAFLFSVRRRVTLRLRARRARMESSILELPASINCIPIYVLMLVAAYFMPVLSTALYVSERNSRLLG